MPYTGGEFPIVGDRVEDKRGRQATVTEVSKDHAIIVKWDEGVVGIEHPTDEFALVARAQK